ncbi:hypothetical protein MANES_08G116111v8 [Manihot esculenta]|uniref:Uncharacterized protein n=1 Tax=Manihot esculenta TaxID=3983 RepID=A0ACB7HD88_MANES|nr:hypothetical protein MANES_08G116111v8 [Manihot esculenta]
MHANPCTVVQRRVANCRLNDSRVTFKMLQPLLHSYSHSTISCLAHDMSPNFVLLLHCCTKEIIRAISYSNEINVLLIGYLDILILTRIFCPISLHFFSGSTFKKGSLTVLSCINFSHIYFFQAVQPYL